MSGVHRLLTRRDKRNNASKDEKVPLQPTYGDLGPIFVDSDRKSQTDKEEEKKIKSILARLQRYGITSITEANVAYALGVTTEEEDAFQLCVLLQDTYEGLVTPYNPNAKLLGAVNRDGVTCYLDALLFAMFARLDSFEAMMYKALEDPARKKLAGLLRLWVNMLRSGRLITSDVTMNLQNALAACGWEAAIQPQQQDTSEAFSFITDKLELPLLTLKMDMFHTGKDDLNDDHKFVNERLLEVAILDKPLEGKTEITLEDCLEHYFNTRVDVRRHLESQRRLSHGSSVLSADADSHHVLSPTADTTLRSPLKSPLDAVRPVSGRKRADSIFSQRRREIRDPEKARLAAQDSEDVQRPSLRTEVLMPAFQFFKLLPWYTDNVPTSDAQVAAHFARKRPVLGICLKRYMFSKEGLPERLDTFVDIPLEIALPDFLSDDNIEEDSPLVGNFKLVLQSVVCHRGTSVNSGHYVALVRGHASNADSTDRPSSPASQDDDDWMLFDDLAHERVSYVDINSAMARECPYLLFYQVQPIEDVPARGDPPSYDEAISRQTSYNCDLPEKSLLPQYLDDALYVTQTLPTHAHHIDGRTSMDAGLARVEARKRTSMDKTRHSIALDDSLVPGEVTDFSGPTTPLDDAKAGFLSFPTNRVSRKSFGRPSRSRQSSHGPDSTNRFSLNMSKLANRLTKSDSGERVEAESTPAVASGAPEDSSVSPADASVQMPDQRIEDINNSSRTSPETSRQEVGRSRLSSERTRRKQDKALSKETSRDRNGQGQYLTRKRKPGKVPDRDCIVM